MRKLLVAALIAGSVLSFEAKAQERAGSAALGAVSGAIVLGPVGAVAGALIGYTAGPAIAHSLGSWAFRIALKRPACNTSQRRNPGGCCQGNAAASCQTCRSGCWKIRAASCQNARNRCLKNRTGCSGI